MNVLVIYDDTQIHAWLIGEPIESAEAHIQNGYQDLLDSLRNGTVKAEVIDVEEDEVFDISKYKVIDGRLTKDVA